MGAVADLILVTACNDGGGEGEYPNAERLNT